MKAIYALLIYLLLSGCSETSDPTEVARSYWAAVIGEDGTAMEKWATNQQSLISNDVLGSMQFDGSKVKEVSFGEALVDDKQARVPTVLILLAETEAIAGQLGEIRFETELVRSDGEWKVDRVSTERNMAGAVFAAAVGVMGQAISQGMKEAVEGVGEAMAEGLTQSMQSVMEGLEDLNKNVVSKNEKSLNPQASSTYQPPVVLSAEVSGSIRGHQVELNSAEWSNVLSLYAGESWNSNPSVLIFLFLDEGEQPSERTITVNADQGAHGHPHVHYRWRNRQTGEIETEVAMSNYDLELVLGAVVAGRVAGQIRFSVPGEATDLAGTFEIQLPDQSD